MIDKICQKEFETLVGFSVYQLKFFICHFVFVPLILVLSFGLTVANGQENSPAAKGEAPADSARKANTRPADEPAVATEPFDGALVGKMALQCVSLETEVGRIEIEMLAEAAPETVRNFLNLASTGMFTTTTFSRVVKGFVIQGGNLATSLNITPALAMRSKRTILDEPNAVKHERGIVSMARPDTPNQATSNFFILVDDAPQLDGKFAAFGRVKNGMEVVDVINKSPAEDEKPVKPVRITRVLVSECAK